VGDDERQGYTALGFAADQGDAEICAALIEYGADPEAKGVKGFLCLVSNSIGFLSFALSFFCSFVRSFVCLLVRSFVRSFVCLLVLARLAVIFIYMYFGQISLIFIYTYFRCERGVYRHSERCS